VDKLPTHTSEAIVGAADHILTVHRARCMQCDCPIQLQNECIKLWGSAVALNKLSCSLIGATYFSIATMNSLRLIAREIETMIGVNPITDTDDVRFAVLNSLR
jgi:hypothetical protein